MSNIYIIKHIYFILIVIFVLGCEKDDQPVLPTDGDGNVYDTVILGTQVWLAENLKTTKYYNGVSIPLVRNGKEWASKTSAAYCWYDNHPDFKNTYGALYNWYTVDSRILCPLGYHVPTKDDLTTLINYLGGEKVAGGKLKEVGLIHWQSPNTNATNETGFTALAGGQRNWDGNFNSIGQYGMWWTSSPSIDYEDSAYHFFITWASSYVNYGLFDKNNGYSVRCIKDN